MTNNDHIRLLEYWRNTLADGSRVEIPVEKAIHQYNTVIDYVKGYVATEQAVALINSVERKLNETKGRLTKDDPDWEDLEETSILNHYFTA